MRYLVTIIDKQKNNEKKSFPNQREALVYATDFRKISSSKVFRDGILIQEYRGQ